MEFQYSVDLGNAGRLSRTRRESYERMANGKVELPIRPMVGEYLYVKEILDTLQIVKIIHINGNAPTLVLGGHHLM